MVIRARLGAVAVALTLAIAACSSDDGAEVRNLNETEEAGADAASASGSASASAPSNAAIDGGSVDAEAGYSYASNVDAHRRVTLDVCEIKDLLDADPIDWDAVTERYVDGGNSVNSDDSIRTIAGFATADDRLHGLDTYYDTPAPLDDWVRSGLDGGGSLSDVADGVRAQVVEKGIQNQVMVAWVVHELNSALAKAADGDIDPESGAPHNWDEAFAFYHGAAPGCAPWATADSRAGNFGTVGADGTTALANEAIVEAMNAGRDALIDGDVDGATEAADEVVRSVVITYSQAAVRYATLVGGDVEAGELDTAAEHRAEGLAFFRVIEAIVADAGADTDAINAVYDLDAELGTTGGGDEVTAALTQAWTALGISEADIGTLDG